VHYNMLDLKTFEDIKACLKLFIIILELMWVGNNTIASITWYIHLWASVYNMKMLTMSKI